MKFNLFIIGLAIVLASIPAALPLNGGHFAYATEDTQSIGAATRESLSMLKMGNFEGAALAASNSNNPLFQKYIRWRYLRSDTTSAPFEELQTFLTQNPDWPGIRAIQAKAEFMIPYDWTPDQTLAWFAQNPPVSLEGKLKIANAYLQKGQKDKAKPLIQEYWQKATITADSEQRFYAQHKALLTQQDHLWRIENMVRGKNQSSARSTARLLGKGYIALTDAKIAYADGKKNAPQLLQKVPKSMRNEAGLLLEQITQRRREEKTDASIALLARQPKNLGELADRYWKERDAIVRRLIKNKSYGKAYDLAQRHGQKDGTNYLEAEFIAGWIALQKLNKIDTAYKHFRHVEAKANSPISLSRAYYWMGRAYQRSKNAKEAQICFQHAAKFPSTFYGQLARQHIVGDTSKFALPNLPVITPAAEAKFRASDAVQVVAMLDKLGERQAVDNFVAALLANATTPEQMTMLIHLCRDINRRDLAVTIARQARMKSVDLIEPGFPMIELAGNKEPEPALVHAIIRQESSFDTEAQSPAGAKGLMQLMPYVAASLSKKLGVAYREEWLISRPEFNMTLGKILLDQTISTYNQSYALAIAAYNAGPSRVNEWLGTYGDPRSGKVDLVDWIEMIPFSETRGYVHRVLENLVIYRYLLQDKEPMMQNASSENPR